MRAQLYAHGIIAHSLLQFLGFVDELRLTRPDDWHLHLRDGDTLAAVLPYSARQFARAIVMPNLKSPITTTALASAYRQRILAALPQGMDFTPLMTLYLTDTTPTAEIDQAVDSGQVFGVKLYPAGATTNSQSGVTNLSRCEAALERMAERGLPLLVHGEVTDPEVDVFDREARFIDTVLQPLRARHPALKLVLEHITTREAVEFVTHAPAPTAATITPQHLLYNRNELFRGGIRPHAWCLPVLKREVHRRAVLEAAISGNARFFLGTDSAPHARHAKESGCGCAGIFSAPAALELYASVFEQAGALNELEAFASFHGPDFYGLHRNTGSVTLRRERWQLAEQLPLAQGETIVPMAAGQTLEWRLV